MMTALVYGYYGKANAGDELMAIALSKMFETKGLSLRFVNKIETLDGIDAVIFGGGSILSSDPTIDSAVLHALMSGNVPVFYMGVGTETTISSVHRSLMNVSKLTYIRDKNEMSDLGFYVVPTPVTVVGVPERQEPLSDLLVIPNVECVPTWSDPHWKHIGWDRYKDEFAQAVDFLLDQKKLSRISFMLMCNNPRQDDMWAANELMGRMKRRDKKNEVFYVHENPEAAFALVSRHKAVITQRYHGIVISEMTGVPYVSIDHHDKLKNATPKRGQHLSYYGIKKDDIVTNVSVALKSTLEPYVACKKSYDDIAHATLNLIEQEKAKRG